MHVCAYVCNCLLIKTHNVCMNATCAFTHTHIHTYTQMSLTQTRQLKALLYYTWDLSTTISAGQIPNMQLTVTGSITLAPAADCKDGPCAGVSAGSFFKV